MWRRLFDSLRSARARRIRTEIDAEIDNHLELRVRDLMASGLSPDAARQEAERRFGDRRAARSRLYAAARRNDDRLRLGLWLDSLRSDTVSALRRIRREPAFSLLSVVTFALGIALTTTMYALLNATVLQPLPFPDSDRLVALYSVDENGGEFPWVSSTNWLDWSEQNRTLTSTALYQTDRVSVAAGTETARVPAANVGGEFFESLGAPMLVGRPLSAEELRERVDAVVVSERFWRRFMDGDPDLGDVVLGGVSRQVVGVMADDYAFPERTDVWQPAIYRRLSGAARNNINWLAFARLAAGVSHENASADLDGIAARIRADAPEAAYSWGVGVVPLKETVVGDADRTLGLLMGAGAFVLLVACANLAGQAYARSLSNLEAGAVRRALGGSRARVLQNQLLEHLLLAGAGGAVGIIATVAATRWLSAGSLPLPRADLVRVDAGVLAFAVAAALTAGLLAGLLPALRVSRTSPRAAMGSVRGAAQGARPTAASWLVAAEMALSVALLIGGGMLVRGFTEFTGRDLGFEPAAVLAAEIELSGPRYEEPAARQAFWDTLLEEVRSLPAVDEAALANELPGLFRSGYGVVDIVSRPELVEPAATYRIVSDGYFDSLRLPVLAGRDFDSTDGPAGERVVLVSRAFAEQYLSDTPIGEQIRAVSMEWTRGSPPLTVIGIVADIDSGYGVETRPAMYVLHRQVPNWTQRLAIAVRAAGDDPVALAGPLRERLRNIDPAVAADVAPLEDHMAEVLARDRLVMSILGAFALITLALAALGIHGLLSFAVARRTRELAIRSALGAARQDILTLVVGGALRLAVLGAAGGAIAAFWLSGWLQSQVTEVDSRDPVVFGAVIVTLLAVTVLAATRPAWRALRLDPARALRAD